MTVNYGHAQSSLLEVTLMQAASFSLNKYLVWIYSVEPKLNNLPDVLPDEMLRESCALVPMSSSNASILITVAPTSVLSEILMG